MLRNALQLGLIVVIALVLAIQVVPYGRAHANPPVRQEPAWDSPHTRELAARACFDCHSNQTRWAWYTSVAPFSWLAQYDVDKGRREVNFSEWDRPRKEAQESAEQVQKGKMPQWYYVALHPEAGLTAQERQELIRGLEATFGRKRER